jgi:hypothetical protein
MQMAVKHARRLVQLMGATFRREKGLALTSQRLCFHPRFYHKRGGSCTLFVWEEADHRNEWQAALRPALTANKVRNLFLSMGFGRNHRRLHTMPGETNQSMRELLLVSLIFV